MEEARQMATEPAYRSGLMEFTWHNIEQPGAYVDPDIRDLYRIPEKRCYRGLPP
jgi:hypothetical protein